ARAATEALSEPAELAAQLLDVLRVQVDRFLIGPQALLNPSVVALVARSHAPLLGELRLRVREQLLLVLELGLENLAAALVAVDRGRRLAPAGRGRRLRGNDLHLLAHHRAVLAYRIALDVGVGRTAARIRALVDLAL